MTISTAVESSKEEIFKLGLKAILDNSTNTVVVIFDEESGYQIFPSNDIKIWLDTNINRWNFLKLMEEKIRKYRFSGKVNIGYYHSKGDYLGIYLTEDPTHIISINIIKTIVKETISELVIKN